MKMLWALVIRIVIACQSNEFGQRDNIVTVFQSKSRRIQDQELKLAKIKEWTFNVSRFDDSLFMILLDTTIMLPYLWFHWIQ